MTDAMLSELYQRAFQMKAQAEALTDKDNDDFADRQRSIAIAKNKLLTELIALRTEQIRHGRD